MNDQDRARDTQVAAIEGCERQGVMHLPKLLRRAIPFAWTAQAFHASNDAANACPADTTMLPSDLIERFQWWSYPAADVPLPPEGQQSYAVAGVLIMDGRGAGQAKDDCFMAVRFLAVRTHDGFQPCVPSGAASWRYGTHWTNTNGAEDDVWIADNIGLWPQADNPDAVKEADSDMLELLWHAAMSQHWLRSKVVGRTSVACARAVRRRAERQQLTPSDIQVITLRHAEPAGSPGDLAAREWACRWIVHGHWRQQFLPSTQGHRPTFIADHVKGPADRPLVVRPGRAYRVSR